MNLLILHLSDMHFRRDNTFTQGNIDNIVNALQTSMHNIAHVLIVVSGDIAYSGTNAEYVQASEFFSKLVDSIKARYGVKDNINVAVVPGNHDVNYHIGKQLFRSDLEQIEKDGSYDSKLLEEYPKMNPFFGFSSKYGCFGKKKDVVDIKNIDLGNKKIQINLINTAAFSSLDEDKGFHYLPVAVADSIASDQNSDFVFTVMHHPHHWYSWRVVKELEAALYERTDLLFVGHEHYAANMGIESNHSMVALYAGGELSSVGAWERSQFYVGVLNIDTREYSVKSFKWDVPGKVYREEILDERRLAKNRQNSLGISPKKDYLEDLFNDNKYAISTDVTEYFVFPLLEEEINEEKMRASEIDSMDELVKQIETTRKICILGHNDDGKTTLAKNIFKQYSINKIVLYLSAENIRRGRIESIIRDAFAETYSEDSALYERFKQLPVEEKMIIIDDVDIVDDKVFQEFLNYVEQNFAYIIQTSHKGIEFDIIERLNKRTLEEGYSFFGLRPFYVDKRTELVTKLVNIMLSDKEDSVRDKIISSISDALSKRRGLFSWNPDFITQFTKYYCMNIGQAVQNDGDIYSKVFESNITSLIRPHLNRMSADKAFYVIDKIAFKMHTDKMDPIDLVSVDRVISEYNEEFDAKIDTVEFLDMLQKAGIIKKVDNKYRFAQRNYLAYFVAREIKRKCQQEGDFTEFYKALEYACFEINADIILFVTYITDNLRMIDKIMEVAEKYISEWEEFSMDPINIPYLADTNPLQIAPVTEEDKEKDKQAEVQHEKEVEKKAEIEYQESVYNYEEGELKTMEQLLRSMSLMVIVSRILPNFEHMMPKKFKDQCVHLIYTLPLRIFNIWAEQLEEVKIELIDEIKSIDDFRYRKEKIFKTDEDVLKFLRWESMSLLLDLMSNSIRNATRDNTYGFLHKYEYKDKTAYRIEHLMAVGKRDSYDVFDDEVCSLFAESKQAFTKIMIQRITRNYMVNSKRMPTSTLQRLNSKIFDNKINQSALLVQKHKAANEEK